MQKLFLAVALFLPASVAAQVPAGSITGQILTREGQPAVAVRVSAMAVPEESAPNGATALISLAMTDNQGHFLLENVLPGRYYVMAGFVDLPTYYPGVTTTSAATVVNVLSGTPVTGINFSAANAVGVTVSGHVRRSSGGALGGQRIAMLGSTAGIQEVTTAPDGSFQFARVRPGTYQLASPGSRTNQPLSIVAADKDITGLEIVVVPTVMVTGSITVEGNAPQPRLQIQLSPFKGNGQNAGTLTQPDGTFRATLPEGEYRVSWSNLPLGYEIKSVSAGSADLLVASLKVSADAPLPPLRIVLSLDGNPFVKVSGRVINLGSTRTLPLSGPSGEIQVTVNPDGTFEIPQALPGNYTTRPGGAVISSAAVPSLAVQPISVVIPNQDTSNLIITLPLTRAVPGIVVNTAGAGVQSRFSLNYSQTSGTSSGSGSRAMTTPADGKFTLEIPVGADVRLSLTVPGYTIQSLTYGRVDLNRESIRVAATDTAEIRVVLDTSTTVTSNPVGGGVSGGVLGGILTTAGTFSAVAPPLAPTPPSTTPAPNITRVTPELAQTNQVSSAQPAYPPLATTARVQGAVVLQIEISAEGRVQNVTVVSGHPLLNDAAIQAVRQWTYKPFVLNSKAIPVGTTVTVNFSLP